LRCRLPSPRNSCTPHSVMAIALHPPSLWSSRVFCSAVYCVIVVRLLFDLRLTSVQHSFNFRLTSLWLSYIVRLMPVQHPSDFCPISFVQPFPSINVCLLMSPMSVHPHWRTIFFKPYVVLELCS
jgi:hypothetical protein